jgi:LacI family transcriptional regulator
MARIRDVAERAGVSTATVSRVLNHNTSVQPELAERVRRAADDLGFVLNRNARRLRTHRSEILAMLIPDVENPFFTGVTRAVEDLAHDRGFSVVLCNTDEEPGREAEYLRVAVEEPVGGIILVPSNPPVSSKLTRDHGVPIVCVDRASQNPHIESAVLDNVAGATQATTALLDAGYQRIACLTGPTRIETAVQRAQGWASAICARTGCDPDATLLYHGAYTTEAGEAAAQRLLATSNPPDAFFAANNKLGLGILRVLSRAGRLPPSVGLAAMGEIPFLPSEEAGLVIVPLPARELGQVAARLLLDRIAHPDAPGRHIVLPCGEPVPEGWVDAYFAGPEMTFGGWSR